MYSDSNDNNKNDKTRIKAELQSAGNQDDSTVLKSNLPVTSPVCSNDDATIVKAEIEKNPENSDSGRPIYSDETIVHDKKIENNTDKTRIQPPKPNAFASEETKINPKRLVDSGAFDSDTTEAVVKPNIDSITLQPGMEIKNRFVLQKRIGSGGMGTIFLAKDKRKEELRDRDSLVVIKVLNDELHGNFDAVVSLQREAKKSQVLSHPNIVTVYDFDREDNTFFISMEYLQGESLDRFIISGASRREKPTQILHYIELMARGLAFAHQEGFVHADFKPANVFLTEQGQIKILDFGIAQAVRRNIAAQLSDETFFDPSSLGALTPNYASYEMLDMQRPEPADDVYALCCVAYELLTGKHPYFKDGKKHTAKQVLELNLQVEPIKGLSRRQMHAIQKGLSIKRENRFANAGEFIDAFKPRKIKRSTIALIAVLTVAVVVSWYMLAAKSDAVIGFGDLPPSMANIVETIKAGDEVFAAGDVNQAHKLYAQAWESSFVLGEENSKDNYKLKVIVDRKVNRVIDKIIGDANKPDNDEFTLMQYELALEFLKKDELGTQDEIIEKTLIGIRQRINELDK